MPHTKAYTNVFGVKIVLWVWWLFVKAQRNTFSEGRNPPPLLNTNTSTKEKWMNGTAGCILLENPKSKCVQGCHQVTWALPQGPSFFAKQCNGCLLQCCFHDTGVYCGVLLLQLEYFSDIPRMSGRTLGVQLRAMRHFALSDTSHPTWASVPMFSFFVTTQIFLWYPADVQLCAMATAFLHYWTTHAQLGQVVQWFPFLLQFKYFSDIPWTSGQTPDVRLCAMAAAFLYYRTTHAQLGRVFRCFPFHNISPFLLPDLFSLLPCLSN